MSPAHAFHALFVCAICVSSQAGSAPEGDVELIALVEEPYFTYEDVLAGFGELEGALAERDDARVVFAAVYRTITEDAIAAIDDGYFDNPDWTRAFLLAFANLYREAFLDYESGRLDEVPEVWQVAFEAAKSDRVSVFQHALLGIHAHINRDFPYAIAEVTPPEDRAKRYPDYLATNRFLLTTIQDVEALLGTIYDTDLGSLDAALGPFDESLLAAVLSQWRMRAWRTAALFDGSRPPWVQHAAAAVLERITAQRARLIAGGSKQRIGE
ncbi:MAG: hypothetical protein IT364_03580 [Candidatus Hydrogenedentes bacterium]|nr:hypothetical protein [Candidatus Hydrogenedentota bacterium]